jgi:histidine ammonia-lyase
MANTCFDGESLTPKKLVELASDFASKIDLAPQCWEKVKKCRDVIDGMVK